MSTLKIADYYARLAQGVQAILDDDKVKEFLRAALKFHRYSFANTIMIYVQRPTATKVAGMRTWNELGRRVKKGEKGIAIFAPVFYKATMKETPAGTEKEAEEAEEIIEETTGRKNEERLTGFKVVYVFDISQTEGKDLPENAFIGMEREITFDGDVNHLYERLLRACPVPVKYEVCPGAARGYYSPVGPTGPVIVLHPNLSSVERPRTLLHEWAHHVAFSEFGEHTMELSDRPDAEILAEGAAFIAASCFGLDTSSASFSYVAGWGRDVKKLLAWGSAVKKVARRIMDAVEGTEKRNAAQPAA